MTQPFTFLVILFLTFGGLSSHAIADALTPLQQSLDVVSIDHIKREIEALKANQRLTEEVRAKLMGLYQTALKKLQESQSDTAQARLYEKLMASAPTQLAKLKQKIAVANDRYRSMKPEPFADISTTELEQQLSSQQAYEQDLNAQLERLENQLYQQRNRPADIRLELTTAQDNLAAIQVELTQIRAASSAPVLEIKAHQAALQASEQALMAEIHSLNLELQSQTPRVQLLKAQSDWVATESNLIEKHIDAIQMALEQKKQSETERLQNALKQSLLATADKHSIIQATIRDKPHLL